MFSIMLLLICLNHNFLLEKEMKRLLSVSDHHQVCNRKFVEIMVYNGVFEKIIESLVFH